MCNASVIAPANWLLVDDWWVTEGGKNDSKEVCAICMASPATKSIVKLSLCWHTGVWCPRVKERARSLGRQIDRLRKMTSDHAMMNEKRE